MSFAARLIDRGMNGLMTAVVIPVLVIEHIPRWCWAFLAGVVVGAAVELALLLMLALSNSPPDPRHPVTGFPVSTCTTKWTDEWTVALRHARVEPQ